MALILGIDPGSRCTGYGIIAQEAQRLRWVAHGEISTVTSNDFSSRLSQIYQGILNIIVSYQPEQAAIEQVFMHQNIQSALKLGHARGAAIVAIASNHIPLGEYSPRQVKQALVGYGAASKSQVAHMVKILLNVKEPLPSDAADALAIAICHSNYTKSGKRSLLALGKVVDK